MKITCFVAKGLAIDERVIGREFCAEQSKLFNEQAVRDGYLPPGVLGVAGAQIVAVPGRDGEFVEVVVALKVQASHAGMLVDRVPSRLLTLISDLMGMIGQVSGLQLDGQSWVYVDRSVSGVVHE